MPVYWIKGEDRAKVDTAIRRLVTRVQHEGGLTPERFDAAEDSSVDVRAACEALSFMGTRLVLVRRADQWKAADVETLIEYLADPLPGTCLALVAVGAPTPRMAKAVEAVGQVLSYGPPAKASPKERVKWFTDFVVREVKRHHASISPKLAADVVRRAGRAGEDAGHLANEAHKLALAAGDEPVTLEMVQALVVVDPEAKLYLLGDLITAGDARGAHALLADLAAGSDTTAPEVIHRVLARHFRGVAVAQAPGATQADVERLTGLKGYPAEKAMEQAHRLPPGAAERCVAQLADLEIDLRVSEFTHLGETPTDGAMIVLEMGLRELIGACGQ